jgi:anti-sigma B factor antagonist
MTHATLTAQRPRLSIPAPRHASPAVVGPRPQAAAPGHLSLVAVAIADDGERLRIYTGTRENYTLVYFVGELDVFTYAAIHSTLLGVLAQAGPRLVLDLGEVTFADARGVSPLVTASNTADHDGGWVHLARVSAHIRKILGIVLLTDKLPIYDTVAAAAVSAA